MAKKLVPHREKKNWGEREKTTRLAGFPWVEVNPAVIQNIKMLFTTSDSSSTGAGEMNRPP